MDWQRLRRRFVFLRTTQLGLSVFDGPLLLYNIMVYVCTVQCPRMHVSSQLLFDAIKPYTVYADKQLNYRPTSNRVTQISKVKLTINDAIRDSKPVINSSNPCRTCNILVRVRNKQVHWFDKLFRIVGAATGKAWPHLMNIYRKTERSDCKYNDCWCMHNDIPLQKRIHAHQARAEMELVVPKSAMWNTRADAQLDGSAKIAAKVCVVVTIGLILADWLHYSLTVYQLDLI